VEHQKGMVGKDNVQAGKTLKMGKIRNVVIRQERARVRKKKKGCSGLTPPHFGGKENRGNYGVLLGRKGSSFKKNHPIGVGSKKKKG